MTYSFFNPQDAYQLAKFQGGLVGAQAGNANYTGIATAPTSIYNQAGYYALMDDTTGYVTLQKLGDESLYTKQWYDQTHDVTYDFSKKDTSVFDASKLNRHMTAQEIAALNK